MDKEKTIRKAFFILKWAAIVVFCYSLAGALIFLLAGVITLIVFRVNVGYGGWTQLSTEGAFLIGWIVLGTVLARGTNMLLSELADRHAKKAGSMAPTT